MAPLLRRWLADRRMAAARRRFDHKMMKLKNEIDRSKILSPQEKEEAVAAKHAVEYRHLLSILEESVG